MYLYLKIYWLMMHKGSFILLVQSGWFQGRQTKVTGVREPFRRVS